MTAVIVGGAASALGAELARQLVGRGDNVALVDRSPAHVMALAARLGRRAEPFVADVGDEGSIAAAVDAAASRFGAVDVVVVNGGIVCTDLPGQRHFDFAGPWNTVHAALPHLCRSSGYALVVASAVAPVRPPALQTYAASWAGVRSFAKALREDVRRHDIEIGVADFPFVDCLPPRGRVSIERMAAQMVAGIDRRARRIDPPRWTRRAVFAHAARATQP